MLKRAKISLLLIIFLGLTLIPTITFLLPSARAAPPQYNWGVSAGQVWYWQVQNAGLPPYWKWEIRDINATNVTGTAWREVVWGNFTVWNGNTWAPVPHATGDDPLVMANLTWQNFTWDGGAHFGLGYPAAFLGGNGSFYYNSLFFLPRQNGAVNMSWVNQSYYILANCSGPIPADWASAISGTTWTLSNATTGQVLAEIKYTSDGVLQEYYDNNGGGNPLHILLLGGPDYTFTPSPTPTYDWGVYQGGEYVWNCSLPLYPGMEGITAIEWNVVGFVDDPTVMREELMAQSSAFNASLGAWIQSWVVYPGPPGFSQPVVYDNLSWQPLEPGYPTGPWGYPSYGAGWPGAPPGAVPESLFNLLIVPRQGDNVNMSWVNSSVTVSGLPAELVTNIAGNTFTVTNTTDGIVLMYATFGSDAVATAVDWRTDAGDMSINFTLYSSHAGTSPGSALPGGQPNNTPSPSNGNKNTPSNLLSFIENPVTWVAAGGAVALVIIANVTVHKRRRRAR